MPQCHAQELCVSYSNIYLNLMLIFLLRPFSVNFLEADGDILHMKYRASSTELYVLVSGNKIGKNIYLCFKFLQEEK